MVTTSFSNPKLCIPINPKEAIQNILQRKENEIMRIKKDGIKIIEKINEFCPTNVSTCPTYHIVQGWQNIFSYVEKLIENASDVVYIVTTLKTISRMYHTSIPDKIKVCERNGCEVRLLTELDDPALKLFVSRLKATNSKFVKLPSKGMVIVSKDKQLIISGHKTQENFSINDKSDTALCTNSQELVSNLFYMCTFLWQNSHALKTSKVGEKK
jgi:sugar-specific transcriptional regulator TrmB